MLSKWMVMVGMFSFPALFSDFISLGGANSSHCLQSIEDTVFHTLFSVCLTVCVCIFDMQTSGATQVGGWEDAALRE